MLAAAYGYVEGAVLSRRMPGWQVISWVLVVMLPVTVVASVRGRGRPPDGRPTGESTAALLYLALVSMYLGFFAWYAGLHRAGVARASQVQLLQPLLTLLWSVRPARRDRGLSSPSSRRSRSWPAWCGRSVLGLRPTEEDLAPEAP